MKKIFFAVSILKKMGNEIRGYQLETCFGTGGCPNRAADSDGLFERMKDILNKADILAFLKKRVKSDLRHHHEFRTALSDCPNACSQPQIKDMGIIGAMEPVVTDEPCSLCQACAEACIEKAIIVGDTERFPLIDHERCMKCGKCITACPNGTLSVGRRGYRVLLGGKLGRHPRLAEELQGIYTEDQVVEILGECIGTYKENSRQGERFSELFHEPQIHDRFIMKISP
ncbi:MAG: 4Fe-4S dicluster domain-containing protein [Pseudomonadota bacterium]